MDAQKDTETIRERLYDPKPGELQLTPRAVIVGCLIGGLVTAMNLYLGLSIGWTEGGSLMAAILGIGLFSVLRPRKKYSILEANITQTAGSGAGTMASAGGLVSAIPAMTMLDLELPVWSLFLWCLSIAYLGVMFAVPLRRQYVVIEKLRFPTGTATANTIVAMFAEAGEAIAKAKMLLYFGIFAFSYVIIAHFFKMPWLEAPPLHEWFGSATLAGMAMWGFSLRLQPFLFGAGFLIGPRVGTSLLAGAIVGWGILGSWAQSEGWAPHENPMKIFDQDLNMWGPRGWILWAGVAIMVADALTSLALSWRTFITAFKGTKSAFSKENASASGDAGDSDDIPNSWWMYGLAAASVLTIVIAWLAFNIPPYLAIIAILLSSVLANVAVRSTGETDINPVGGMGKVTQAAFGGLTTNMSVNAAMSTNLMCAGITGAGASQAGDMMHDLKSGYLLGASPRGQFKAQLCGIAAGVLFGVPIYLLYDSVYDIGGETSKLGAPAAVAWKAVAEVLSKGFDELPQHADMAILGGLLFGALIPIIRKLIPKVAPYTPSGLAFGIAFIVQPYFSIPMFLGSMALVIWRNVKPEHCTRFVFAVACGLIAGEGVGGFVNAMHLFIGNFM